MWTAKGRLRVILALLRYTRGRRLGAICALRADDVLLTADQIRATLAASGMDERLAAHMPHGAIRWSEQSDKMGLLFVSPLSEPARAALETCLRQSPRLGSVPLLPAPKCASVPIDSKLVGKWIRRAERRAGLPKLRGSTAHAYRRLWASERKNLPDVDVAAAGGWKDTRSLKTSDQQADPASVLNAVLHGSG
jgi:integrase